MPTSEQSFTTDLFAWSEPLPGKAGWQLLDPATQKPLQADRPHQWIEADPLLGSGMLHLWRYGNNVAIDMRLGNHTSPEQLGDDLEFSVHRADAYCFELYGWNRQAHVDRMHMIRAGGALPDDLSPLKQRMFRAAALKEAPYSFSDEPEDTAHTLDRFLIDTLRSWTPQPHETLTEEKVLRWLAARAIRESYKIAKFGSEMSRLGLGEGASAHCAYSVGANHNGLGPRFRQAGVQVVEHLVTPAKGISLKGKVLGKIAVTNQATHDDIVILMQPD